jgi:hypothetical protein
MVKTASWYGENIWTRSVTFYLFSYFFFKQNREQDDEE